MCPVSPDKSNCSCCRNMSILPRPASDDAIDVGSPLFFGVDFLPFCAPPSICCIVAASSPPGMTPLQVWLIPWFVSNSYLVDPANTFGPFVACPSWSSTSSGQGRPCRACSFGPFAVVASRAVAAASIVALPIHGLINAFRVIHNRCGKKEKKS